MQDFLIPFVSILAAEFGDKTMIAVLLLSAKTRHPLLLLAGAMLGFSLVDGSAIVFGAWSGDAIPLVWLKWGSAALFLFLGVRMLTEGREENEEEVRHHDKHPLVAGFLVVFVAEWGDKTQIAAALFSSRYDPWQVAAGTLSALFVITAAAAFLGQWIGHHVKPGMIQKSAALIFIVMGILTLLL